MRPVPQGGSRAAASQRRRRPRRASSGRQEGTPRARRCERAGRPPLRRPRPPRRRLYSTRRLPPAAAISQLVIRADSSSSTSSASSAQPAPEPEPVYPWSEHPTARTRPKSAKRLLIDEHVARGEVDVDDGRRLRMHKLERALKNAHFRVAVGTLFGILQLLQGDPPHDAVLPLPRRHRL